MLKLEIHDVRLSFGPFEVLKGVNASFTEKTMNSVIGINGAGKSVLMKSIAGLLKAQGHISLTDGEQKFGHAHIAYVPQMAYSTSALTAVEMVLLGKVRKLNWRVRDDVLREVDEMMERLNIGHLAEKKFSDLSGGQKQMVIMAQSFISRPRLLLLDEPTSALDLYHQLRLLDVTREYCQEHNAIAIVVMHDLSLVSRFSDEIVLLNEGRSVRQGRPDQVLIPDLLEQVYHVVVDVSRTASGFTTVTPVRVAAGMEPE